MRLTVSLAVKTGRRPLSNPSLRSSCSLRLLRPEACTPIRWRPHAGVSLETASSETEHQAREQSNAPINELDEKEVQEKSSPLNELT